MCCLQLADDTISKFSLAQPPVHVPAGFEDYLLVRKKYQLHDNNNQEAIEEVMYGLFNIYSYIYVLIIYIYILSLIHI